MNTVDKTCQSNATIMNVKHTLWQRSCMFRHSLSHLQVLMIQNHTKKCTMHCGIPTLTISVAYLHVLIVIHSHCHSLQTYLQHTYMFSLSFTLTVIHYRHICSIHTCSHCHSLSLSLTTDISVAYIHVLIVIHYRHICSIHTCSHCHSLSLSFTTDIVSVEDPTMHSTFFVWICIMRAWRWLSESQNM